MLRVYHRLLVCIASRSNSQRTTAGSVHIDLVELSWSISKCDKVNGRLKLKGYIKKTDRWTIRNETEFL